ncbi:hypothetical protein N7450_011637 [Penicillium hetheringtonii]|uniref:Methyltransferase type 11 domain-containing protein n=1 Tax=Penicillium hetheringtonii TaxID=911720 RepID=A0AAD6GL56_9EURO|nr:hypothetical protein N7450_011637 [Penicillium hetheringtonii]
MAEGNIINKPAWYQTKVQSINAEARRLFENYSGFKPDEVLPHVLKLLNLPKIHRQRDEAFSIWHYPCIGQLRFLSFSLPEHTVYSRVLARLREDPSSHFLEAGCYFGQEIRYLADQGIPGIQLMGCDVEPAFFDLGYKLFRDQNTLGATFVSGDLTSEQCLESSTGISRCLANMVDIVFASSLFQLWNYECQVHAAINFGSPLPR